MVKFTPAKVLVICLVFIQLVPKGSLARRKSSYDSLPHDPIHVEDGECNEIHQVEDVDQKCYYARESADCKIDSGYVNYIAELYCTFKGPVLQPLGFAVYVLLFIYLVLAIAVTSDRIFVPNLSAMANAFHLSESVAGETLLPLGNGAADIFTSIAAAVSMKDGDVGILYGTLLGSGILMTTIIVGAVILIKPFHTMQRPLLRVLVFYLVAIFVSFVVIWDGVITIVEASVFLILYVVYLVTVLTGPKLNALLVHWAQKRNTKKAESKLVPDDRKPDSTSLSKPAEAPSSNTTAMELQPIARPPEITVTDVTAEETSMPPTGRSSANNLNIEASRTPTVRFRAASLDEKDNVTYRKEFRLRSSSLSVHSAETNKKLVRFASQPRTPQKHHAHPPNVEKMLVDARLSRVARMLIRQESNRQAYRHGTSPLPDRRKKSINKESPLVMASGSPNPQADVPSKLEAFLTYASSSSSDESDVEVAVVSKRSSRKSSVNEGLPSRQGSAIRGASKSPVAISVGTRDLAVVEEASPSLPLETSPISENDKKMVKSSDNSSETSSESSAESDVVVDRPLWKWLLEGLNPIEMDEWAVQGVVGKALQVVKAPLVFLILLTTSYLDEERPMWNWNRPLYSLQCFTMPLFIILALNELDYLIEGIIPIEVIVGAFGLGIGLLVFISSDNTVRPKYHIVFAFVGFVSTAMWIYLFANEVVNLIRCFGLALNLSDSLLALTFLSWGNCIGDLINDIAVAKQGFSKMAISACFSSALFNTLLGLGIPLVITTIDGGQLNVKLPDILLVMFGFTGLAVASSFVAIPIIQRFYVRRPFAIYLFVVYGACLVCVILAELHILNFTDHI